MPIGGKYNSCDWILVYRGIRVRSATSGSVLKRYSSYASPNSRRSCSAKTVGGSWPFSVAVESPLCGPEALQHLPAVDERRQVCLVALGHRLPRDRAIGGGAVPAVGLDRRGCRHSAGVRLRGTHAD